LSTLAIAGRGRRAPFGYGRQAGMIASIVSAGVLVGWSITGPGIGLAAAVCVGIVALVIVAAIWGYEGFAIALVVASMLPLPTVSLLGTVRFPLASAAVLVIPGAAVWVSRRRGTTLLVPHLWPYLTLVAVAVVSLAASWLFWDPRVPTGIERGYGHRWIGYQITGLYLLVVPLLAFAGGVLSSRLLRLERLFGAVLLAITGLTLFALATWIQHPANPIDAFYTGDRVKLDYQWAAILLVMSVPLLFYAQRPLLRLVAVALLVLAAVTWLVEYVLSAWLGVLAAVMVMIWLRFRMRGIVLFVGALVMVGLILEPTVATIVSQRSNSPDVDRLKIWQSALVVWSKGPVIGVGPGNLASYMETYSEFPLGLVLQGYQQAHNIFLEILAEEGAVGLVMIGIFTGLIVRSLVRMKAASPLQSYARTVALGLLVSSAVIASFGAGFVPTVASAGYNVLPYVLAEWFVIGCGVGVAQSHGGTLKTAGARVPLGARGRG
jgi:O-antigen ligase